VRYPARPQLLLSYGRAGVARRLRFADMAGTGVPVGYGAVGTGCMAWDRA